ncbi:putative aminotransferase [Smittium mucronatum]|uniref:Putative aminotransferase n=1 Tax=Smittium mucronatum TaxID=133383 RepID=A0A1R0H5E9_9FUNG|nr:putative aminotransferase [Smittium mucronatum]
MTAKDHQKSVSKNTSLSVIEPSETYKKAKLDVWTMFNIASAKSKAVNLGQGFMNFPVEDFIKKAGADSIVLDSTAQYPSPKGSQRLLKALSKRYSEALGREIDPNTEIMVAAGANEDGRNETVVMEPAFDQYTPNVAIANGKTVYVPMRVDPSLSPETKVISSNDWKIDMAELEAAITPKTKVLILNTPHNPTGKVFSLEELVQIADLAKKYNLLVVSDEVYENLYYDDTEHISIASIDGMFERTLVIGSMGKMFCVTGWRIGWIIGPERLVSPCLAAHKRIVFVASSPLQEACAISFEQANENGYFERQRKEYIERRKKLMDAFDSVGLPYSIPHGSYFLLVNANKVKIPDSFEIPDYVAERGKGFILSYFFTVEIGIGCIPPAEFYSEANVSLADDYVRFAFCKTDDIFEETARRLKKITNYY